MICPAAFTLNAPGPETSGASFRHGTRFLRWRPDKDPRQCTLDQMSPKKSRARDEARAE